jgi:hypothetical protein
VVSALRADRISSRRLSFPFSDRRKLAQAVAFEVEGDVALDLEQEVEGDVALDLEQVVVDWAIVGGDKSRAEVVASIAPRAEVSELIDTLRGAASRTRWKPKFVLRNLVAAFDLLDGCWSISGVARPPSACGGRQGHRGAQRTGGGRSTDRGARQDRLLGPGRGRASAGRLRRQRRGCTAAHRGSTPWRARSCALGAFEP